MKRIKFVLFSWLYVIALWGGYVLLWDNHIAAQTVAVESTESILIVDTYADLASIAKRANRLVQTRGYASATDGAGSLYRYDAATDAYVALGSLTDVQAINVKQHGAVGDGVADDTAAIQTLLATCDSKRIYFPTGTYKITSTVTLNATQTHFIIEGDAQNTVIAATMTDGSAAIDLNDAQHFTIRDIKIASSAGGTSVQNFVGLDFNSANRWLLDNVTVYNAANGVEFDAAHIGQIVNLFVRYSTKGFSASGMNDVHGTIKLENVAQGFTAATCRSCDLHVLCEGNARTTSSTIEGSDNIKLHLYTEDNAATLRTVPELVVGASTRCSNLDIWLRSTNVAGPAKTFTADDTTDTMTATAHGFSNGTPCLITTTGTRPAPLGANVVYWIVNVAANTFQLSTAPSGSAIDITTAGSGTHTATAWPDSDFISLDLVNGCEITSNLGVSTSHRIIATTTNTKNLTIRSLDPSNVPYMPSIVPASRGMFGVLNYWPDPFMFDAIPTLTNSSTTNAEETTIVPPFASRSLKVSSTGTVTSNTAFRVLTFAEYPHLAELKGKLIGVGWWQYYAADANYSSSASGNGPDVRLLTNGASPASTTVKWGRHERDKWHFNTTELTVPADATQITQYYYSNRGVINSDATMIAYFVGPLVWVGGQDNAQRVLAGDISHHPASLQNNLRRIRSGTGSPESAVTASVGTLYLRTDGGASTTLYVKESGTGNTGWVAK